MAAFHRSRHHPRRPGAGEAGLRVGASSDYRRREEDAGRTEHMAAYAAAVASALFAVLGILVGFDVFDGDNTFYDGLTWHLLSLLCAILAFGLHGIEHHQPEVERDSIRVTVREGEPIRASQADGTTSRSGMATRR